MIKTRLFLILILLSSWQGFCQNIKGNVDIDDTHLPNGASGGGSNIVNVDLFTGTGSVNIPIYSYNIDGVDASISLSYAARGIQVDQIASSVGLGWQLQAGGSVTREVNGLEDEVTLPVSFTGANADSLQGYLVPGATISQNNITPKDDDKEQDLFHFTFGGRSLDVVFKKLSNGTYTWQTYPKSEVKIEILTRDSSGSGYGTPVGDIGNKCGLNPAVNILCFIVTDEHGNRFKFEKGDHEEKEYKFKNWSVLDTSKGVYYPIEKWDLTQIVTFKGHVINFEYELRWMDYVETRKEELHPLPEKDNGVIVTYDPLEITDVHWKGVRSHIKKIIYPNGITATFTLNSGTRCDCPGNFVVRSIEIEEKYDNAVKNKMKYNLGLGFFRSAGFGLTAGQNVNFVEGSCNSLTGFAFPSGINLDSAKEMFRTRGLRMKLAYIDRIGTDNSTQERYYTFDYNTTALPYRLDHHKDYYGYYNGNQKDVPHKRTDLAIGGVIDSIYTSIPYPAFADHTYTGNITVYDSAYAFGYDRRFDAASAQAWALSGVTNTLGGTNKIYYQDYTLANPDSSYGNLGLRSEGYANTPIYTNIDPALQGADVNDGLCIWKVEHKDGFNADNATVTEYTFSDGIRFHRGGYCWYRDLQSVYGYNIYTNYFLSPFKYFHGSNHGFSNVTVTEKGLSNNYQLAKTAYNFSNLIYTDANGHPQSWMLKPTGSGWHTAPADFKTYRMGLPLTVQSYDEQNNLTSKTVNFYEDVITTADSIKNWRFFDGYAWKYLLLDYERVRLIKTAKASYVYDVDLATTKTMTDTVSYSFDDNDNPTCTVSKNSKRETIKEYVRYNYDYSSLYSSNQTLFRLSAFNVQTPILTQIWKMGFNDSTLLSMQVNSPSTDLPNYIPFTSADLTPLKYLSFEVSYATKIKDPLPSASAASTSYINIPNAIANSGSCGSALLRGRQVTRYDRILNPVELKYGDRDKYESFIFDTHSSKKLAEVQNARYDDIAFTSFEGQYEEPPAADEGRGNWDFTPAFINLAVGIPIPNAITGKYVYELQTNQSEIQSKPLKNKKYILSLWKRQADFSGIAADVRDNNGNPKISLSFTEANTVGDWKLYIVSFLPDSGDHVTIYEPNGINPGSTYVDEVRLHPADASMTSYTYYPLFGVSSVTNPDNYINYYDYDVMGRNTGYRDMRGNIIKKYEYAYDQATLDDGTTQKPSATNNPYTTTNQ